MFKDLENQVALTGRQQALLLEFARRVLCEEAINVRAAEAWVALEGALESFDVLIDRFEKAGAPFMLRAFDSGMQVSRSKLRQNLRSFLLAALRTLCTVCFDSAPTDADEDKEIEEIGFDPGHELGILSYSQIGEWDSREDEREWTYDELTGQVAEDCRGALELIAPGASQRACYVFAALLMELAGFAPKPTSGAIDQTRYERTRRYIRNAKNRQSPPAPPAADGG